MPPETEPARPGRRRGELPLIHCPACGSGWFREVHLYRYRRRFDTALTGAFEQAGLMPMTVLVCLCGRFMMPGYVPRAGRIASRELLSFFDALGRSRESPDTHGSLTENIVQLQEELADTVLVGIIRDRIDILAAHAEALAGMPETRRRRESLVSSRTPAAEGLDRIVTALQHRGFGFRAARQAVWAVCSIWKDALGRGEAIEIPGGALEVVASPPAQVRRRFGREQVLFRRGRRVRFRPVDEWELAEEAGEENMPTQTQPNDSLICPCGSRWFFEAAANQYYEAPFRSGQMHVKWDTSEKVYVCLCGRTHYFRRQTVGKPAGGNQDLRNSVRLALARLDALDAAVQDLKQVRYTALSKAALAPLNTELQKLEQTVTALQRNKKRRQRRSRSATASPI